MTPFGQYLETLRRSRGLQQQQVADRVNVAACYLSSIEKGRKGPPADDVIDALIAILALNEQEAKELKSAAERSIRRRVIPGHAALHEYSLIHQLWERLGTLSEAETQAISHLLMINSRSA